MVVKDDFSVNSQAHRNWQLTDKLPFAAAFFMLFDIISESYLLTLYMELPSGLIFKHKSLPAKAKPKVVRLAFDHKFYCK